VSDAELEKVKLQAEASMVFGQVELLNRAMNLAFANFLGDTELVNKELELVQAVTAAQVNQMAQELLKPENSNVLLYKAE
jgi:predicted Zn-dependent peptidase